VPVVAKPAERGPEELESMNRRVRIRIHGIVQGVGFRPHVYHLAKRHHINGWVRNQADGVEVEAFGRHDEVTLFVEELGSKAPPLARIVHQEFVEIPDQHCESSGFRILHSQDSQPRVALISPDVCICDDCLKELLDPSDRRYRYPFTNCTNCGPRYTIIRDIPYDRHKTTMAPFTMCNDCALEYHDPDNRRFHAQPNACWHCGPQVWLETTEGKCLAERDAAIAETISQLAGGAIVAIKGLGGFHLAVLATNEYAVNRLRRRKVREEKPFAVMFSGPGAVEEHCLVDNAEMDLLLSRVRPIVLLERRRHDSQTIALAPSIAPRNRRLGAFLPYTPLHTLLFAHVRFHALVMTSGNRSDEPIATANAEARERLSDIADLFLFHDREIYLRCDDSVACTIVGKPLLIRRARGFAPAPVFLRESLPAVLAVGAELKNTVCLVRGHEAFVSQHVGDLENQETLSCFEHTIDHLQRILHVQPQVIAHDLHPDYLSSQWALQQPNLQKVGVQHHHAHIASVYAEHRLTGAVLGLALDGTGYGSDGTVWGGEILRVAEDHWVRLGHLRQVPLPGGNMAAREPWRMAVSYLWSLSPEGIEEQFRDLLSRWPSDRWQVVLQMLRRGVHSPLTSSCGRLFDAVSALIGFRDINIYEGQAAIELEQLLEPHQEGYQGDLTVANGLLVVDPLPMVSQVVADMRAGQRPGEISGRFHRGLVQLLADALASVAGSEGLHRILLSGGVFQNAYLSEQLESRLRQSGFEVYSHHELPPNDGCIALGQAFVAGHWWLRHSRD
jgi:hydrogenase maturation protein HypF